MFRAPFFAFLILALCNLAHAWDTLGYGISPYNGFLDLKNLKVRILDLGALHQVTVGNVKGSARQNVSVIPSSKRYDEKTTGKGFDEFTRKLFAKVKASVGFSVFKASVSTHYKADTTVRNDYFFSRFTSLVEHAHLRISVAQDAQLQALLFPDVRQYLLTASPQQIFSSYGTHVTTGIIVGGHLQLWSSSETSKFSSETEFSAAVDASYKKFVSGGANLTDTEQRNALKVSTEEGLIALGGDIALAQGKVSEWVASVPSRAREIEYLPSGVLPIWRLIPNATKAREVQNWYGTLYGANALYIRRFSSQDVSERPRVSHPQASVTVPAGWKVLSGGATVKAFGAGQMLTKSYPIIEDGVPKGWLVESIDHRHPDPGQCQAHAIAIFDPFDEWDIKVVSKRSARVTHPFVSVTLPDGYHLVGGGANDMWSTNGNMLTASYPSELRTWTARGKAHFLDDPSAIDVYAIGMRNRKGRFFPHRRVKSDRFGPVRQPHGMVTATFGYRFVGGGAYLKQNGHWGTLLVQLVPSADGRTFKANGKDHLRPDLDYITVYGIELQGAVYVSNVSELLGTDFSKLLRRGPLKRRRHPDKSSKPRIRRTPRFSKKRSLKVSKLPFQ